MGFKQKFNDYFEIKGNKWFIAITIIELVFYILYTALYLQIHNETL
jgi:hypothetical protein